MATYPQSLAPSYFDIEELPTYGLKIVEDELGKEVRRFTETTGHHTRLSVRYTGMRGTEVAALIGFYQSVKGTFGSFTLPPEFYLNPSSYNMALALLEDTTNWRFESPPSIETIQNDIYTTQFTLLSLKNEEELNFNTIFGILSSVNLKLTPGRIRSEAREDETVLAPLMDYDVPEVFLADVEFVNPPNLEFFTPQVKRTSTAEVKPLDLTINTGNLEDSAEFFLFASPLLEISLPELVVDIVDTQGVNAPASMETFTPLNVTGVDVPQANAVKPTLSFTTSLMAGFRFPDIEVVNTIYMEIDATEDVEVVDPLPEIQSSATSVAFSVNSLNVVSPIPKEPVNKAEYTFQPTTSIQVFLVDEATPKPLNLSYGYPTDLTTNEVTLVPCIVAGLLFTLPPVNNVGAFVRQIIKPTIGLFPEPDLDRNEVDFESVMTGQLLYSSPPTIETRNIDSQGSITPEMNFATDITLGEAIVQSRNEQSLGLTMTLPLLEEGVIVYEELVTPQLNFNIESGLLLDFPDVQPISEEASLEYTSYDTDGIEIGITGIVSMSIVPSEDFRGVEEGIRTVDAPTLSFSREFIGFVFTTDGFGLNFEKRSGDFTAYGNAIFSVNTSSGDVIATISPVASDDGKLFIFADANGTLLSNSPTGFGNNKLTIRLLNSTMAGLSELDLDVDNQGISLVYCHADSTFTIWGNAN